MKLELLVSRMVVWTRMIERVLHDPGPWSFRTAGGSTPAHRILDRDRGEIIFMGIARPSSDGIVELWAGEEFVSMTAVDLTREEELTWKLSLQEAAPAC
jgi:hypothetical protein